MTDIDPLIALKNDLAAQHAKQIHDSLRKPVAADPFGVAAFLDARGPDVQLQQLVLGLLARIEQLEQRVNAIEADL